MIVAVLKPTKGANANEWEVWVQLQDGDPMDQAESFIIGTGPDRTLAVLNAVNELNRAANELLRGLIMEAES